MKPLKNLAIVAHVDHGKTTLIDQIFKQAGIYSSHEVQEDRVMDSGELEREKGITIRAKNCSINWKGTRINLLDTPGHADFGGEVERSLMMVDGIMLLVDAAEGPLPQTRFVLTKAVERGLKVAVVINKVDRADARIDEVLGEIEDLFLEIASLTEREDFDIGFPIFYGSGRAGYMSLDKDNRSGDLSPMLDFLVGDYFPAPKVAGEGKFQMLLANLSYSNYLGTLVIGRIERGQIKVGEQCTWVGRDKQKNFKVTGVQVYDGLKQSPVEMASFGEIIILSGLDHAEIGDSLCAPDCIEPLQRIEVEPPTVSVNVSVNTSPLAGKEGEYMTSRNLEEFLNEATRKNVSLKYAVTDDPKVYALKARGELQIAIVFEELRRSGYEVMLSRPTVITQTGENGETLEPFERLVVDVPSEFTGVITEKLSSRKGKMESMLPLGELRTRMEFSIPSRSLIGYRSVFLTDTRGQGLMSSYFLGYFPSVGKLLGRANGALISDRAGKTTAYALFNLLSSGKQFVKVGEEVYEGQVIGESTRTNDLNVNVVREKHVSAVRTAGKDENLILPSIPERTLEWALDWIDDDEWVEVTPKNVRIRKKNMDSSKRSVVR
ncbi:MAG: GTP-binding protein [Bacteriovoracaceae bacterium]|nr:GTP-binding protein [Bacteriovoracaceae bacterium]